jgi:recombination protein RecA
MAKSERISLSDKLAQIQKKQGVKIGTALEAIEPVTAMTTGNIVLDHLTGVGGIPRGRVTEVFGYESSGKSTIALQTVGLEQKRLIDTGEEGYIVFLDHEKALDKDYMKALGIDTSHESFIMSQPTFLEQGAEIAVSLLEDLPIKAIIWDSVGTMVPRSRVEGDFDQRTAAMNRARLLTGLLQTVVGPLATTNCAGIFVNHLYQTIPTGYGQIARDTTTGGKGLDYYSSLRLKITAGKKHASDIFDTASNDVIGVPQWVDTTFTVAKNKVAPNAYRQATVRLRLGQGFVNFWSVVQVLRDNKYIAVGGKGMHYFNAQGKESLAHDDMSRSGPTGRPAIQGEHNVVKFAESHPDWADYLTKLAQDVLKRNPDSYRISDSAEDVDEDPELDNA